MPVLSHFIGYKLRHYPLSILCIVVIWVLCFCTPPHTPLDNVALMDKWTHIVMYLGTCSVILAEYWLCHPLERDRQARRRWMLLLLVAWLAPVVMSGIIELLQAYCTNCRRSGDWMDFLANSIGATLGQFVGIGIARWCKRR